ncbi:MAG: efflux RND transporter periplasmic adaptor subunit [Myxococcales bacterium]|jgi:cobalt-zinc-cadmium efflux system membrane fusion protein|nr:efflux RND transporter periplasmic adaptor subunit [Myxococcales bacterium]
MNTEIRFTPWALPAAPRLILLLSSMALVACEGPAPRPPSVPTAPVEDGDHADHDHGAGDEISDLDRPIAALVAMRCEHDVPTFTCDECRYEVGFVRANASLIRGGLLTTTKPERRKVSVPIALTGVLQFDDRRVGHVSTQVEGILRQVRVGLGDKVKKGEPLLEIESVAVGEGQAAHLEAQGLLKLARSNFERVKELRRERIASEREFLQAQQELSAAEIRASSAASKLSRLGSIAADGRLVLRAPIDGTVFEMHAVSGEVAKTDTPLLTVSDSGVLWAWANLYERDLAAVKKGQAAQAQNLDAAISVKAYPGETFPGTVELVSPAMDEDSRTVKVRIQVKNDDGRLLAGMFAAIQIFLPGAEEALALPSAAVLHDEGRDFVFVHHDGDDWVRRPVRVGRRWAGWVEIEKGVEPSQTVMADGAFLLKSDVLRSKMGAGCAD